MIYQHRDVYLRRSDWDRVCALTAPPSLQQHLLEYLAACYTMLARQIVVRERMEPIARGDFWVPIAAKARRSIRFFSSPEAERPYLELLRGGFTKELRQRGRERRETNRYLLWLDFERPPDFGAFTEEQLQILDYLDAPNRNVDRYVSAVLGRFGESIPARYGKEGESWLTKQHERMLRLLS